MFEDIDPITIQNANDTIKGLYEKYQNYALEGIISKEEITERDFDNMFIFEDFFSELLAENIDDSTFRQRLLEDIVDLIELNSGDITINELYDILTNKPENVIIKKKSAFNYDFSKDKPLKSLFDVVYGDNHHIDLNEITDYEKYVKRVDNDAKIDNVNKRLLLLPTNKKSKSKIHIGRKEDKEQTGEEIKPWNLFDKKN